MEVIHLRERVYIKGAEQGMLHVERETQLFSNKKYSLGSILHRASRRKESNKKGSLNFLRQRRIQHKLWERVGYVFVCNTDFSRNEEASTGDEATGPLVRKGTIRNSACFFAGNV